MSKQTSSLFNLIHSMSKGEKRHLKLYARYHSKNTNEMNSLRLFDALSKQKKYDEEKIIQKAIVKKKHLRVLKHRLHHLVLESLRVLHSKRDNTDHKIKNWLENAYIMRDKGMVEEEMKFIEKTKKLALKHERWGIFLETLLMERGKAIISVDLKARQETEVEIDQLLITLRNLQEYIHLASRIFMHIHKSDRQWNAENNTLKKLILHPLLSNAGKALSAEAKKLYYNTIFLYCYFVSDYKNAHKIISQSLRFAESNYSTVLFPEENHSVVLNNFTTIQHTLGKYKEAFSTIQKHRSLVNESGQVKEHAFIFSYVNETHLYIILGEFEKGSAIIKDIESGLHAIKFKISDMIMMALWGNIAVLYFGVGEYQKSLPWINKIVHHPKVLFREDIQSWARILLILIHYELRTPDILEHLNVSAYRFLFKRKQLHQVEKIFLGLIGKLEKTDPHRQSQGASEKVRIEEFRKVRDELVQITKVPEEKKALDYFDLISWLESKIESRPFAEIVKEKAKSR